LALRGRGAVGDLLPLLGPGRGAGRAGARRLLRQPHAGVRGADVGRGARRGAALVPCTGLRADRRRHRRLVAQGLTDNRAMDIDAQDLIKPADDKAESDRATALLNTVVAITVALLATFMGVCKVKDDNIVQAMQQAQADKLDHWNFYQARNIRQEVAEATAMQLRLAKVGRSPDEAAGYDQAIARYDAKAAAEAQKK